jgi:hypothetical protein
VRLLDKKWSTYWLPLYMHGMRNESEKSEEAV